MHRYLVVDLIDRGDLRFYISRKTFTEEANLTSGLTPGKPLIGKSGTLAYLAPESLGVLLYKCIYNKRPFEGSTQTTLAGQVTKANPAFPVTSPPVSLLCLGAISSALDENPTKRMSSAGFHSFTDNPFFRSIDFDALERKEIEPVFVPSSLKTNFDPIYDLEELLLEETPLEVLARRQRPRRLKDNATDKEIREYELFKMIETQFELYNYEKSAYDRYAPDLHQPHPTLRLIVLLDTRIVSKRCPLTHANDRHPTKPPRTPSAWTELAQNDATLPADEKANAGRPPVTLGFWNRVTGHAYSPKRQQRGILGKVGARVILASGHSSGDLKSHVF
ncbi:hypothetical protein BKA64DRAFT_736639 [Cadophora sp. MPI-SDFR-AT-0126]|nr:hypothetical protein BKA64DRAFT_736639 [Leotiomycetes sp. MPI-SDFR-AT-0126]